MFIESIGKMADPHEVANLIASTGPEDHDALTRLRAALETWITETHDQGVTPEAAEIIASVTQEMHAWFGTPRWEKAP